MTLEALIAKERDHHRAQLVKDVRRLIEGSQRLLEWLEDPGKPGNAAPSAIVAAAARQVADALLLLAQLERWNKR